LVYMDDILIFSKDREKLEELTLQVLKKLHENDLFLNLDKCIFDVEEVDYLGMIVSEDQIKMDPIKLAGIANWPTPNTIKQVRSFLGFGNFYRRFIPHYATITHPLNDLTKKDLTWNWTVDCQEAFDTLKTEFQKAPLLLMPDNTLLYPPPRIPMESVGICRNPSDSVGIHRNPFHSVGFRRSPLDSIGLC
jgi:hypothetical protein